MDKKEYLYEIKKSIELLSKEKCDKELRVLYEMVCFRKNHNTPELQSLTDIFYFLNGILFEKGLSDYWNGRKLK